MPLVWKKVIPENTEYLLVLTTAHSGWGGGSHNLQSTEYILSFSPDAVYEY